MRVELRSAQISEGSRMATSLSAAIPERPARTADLWIGDWHVRPAANEIAREGEIVRLEPKAMEVLVFLAKHAGEVVSRDALLSAVWPDAIVGDDALTQAVIKLRKALGDPSRSPQYIETISKRGYRLIATIAGDRAVAPERSAVAASTSGGAGPRRRSRTAIALAALLLAVVAAGAWYALWRYAEVTTSGSTEPADRWDRLPTIAVAPFETVAADNAETYLALGIAADLTTDLSRLAGLRAISLPRSEQGKGDTAPSLARYLISGTVQRAQQALRINVRLVDTSTKAQLWALRPAVR